MDPHSSYIETCLPWEEGKMPDNSRNAVTLSQQSPYTVAMCMVQTGIYALPPRSYQPEDRTA